MNINHILIVNAEPKSIFLEILIKYFKSKNFKKNKKKYLLVGNKKIIQKK